MLNTVCISYSNITVTNLLHITNLPSKEYRKLFASQRELCILIVLIIERNAWLAQVLRRTPIQLYLLYGKCVINVTSP